MDTKTDRFTHLVGRVLSGPQRYERYGAKRLDRLHVDPLFLTGSRGAEVGSGRQLPHRQRQSSEPWSDTTVENGGAPFPSFNVITGYLQCFPRGAKLKKLRIFGSGLSALASDNCVMMVNQTANDMQVSLGSRSIDLKAFETKFLH